MEKSQIQLNTSEIGRFLVIGNEFIDEWFSQRLIEKWEEIASIEGVDSKMATAIHKNQEKEFMKSEFLDFITEKLRERPEL